MFYKTKLVILALIVFSTFQSSIADQQNTEDDSITSWSSFINTLNHCTIQVFYVRINFGSWDIISNQLPKLNDLSKFNFVVEDVSQPKNRYTRANVTQKDGDGIIRSFPFIDYDFSFIFSNCHVAIMFSPPVHFLIVMWGIAAFNEDPDYIIILDQYPGRLHYKFNYYFDHSRHFRLASIILYSNMTSNALSIVCHTCTPPQEITRRNQNDESFLVKRLFPVEDSTLSEFSRRYRQMMNNMNLHAIWFTRIQRFWKISCSLKHCGWNTPQTTCPVSELMLRLNFTDANLTQDIIGYASSNHYYSWKSLKENFWIRGLVQRSTWIKTGMRVTQIRYTIYALPTHLNAISFLKIFDILSVSILIIMGCCSSLIIFKNKKFVHAPVAWTVSIFLQQATHIVIKPGEAKVTRLRVFMNYLIVLIWLFNGFFVGSMFSGEFFSLFTSNRVPPLPHSLKELVLAKDIPMYSLSRTVTNNKIKVSTVKDIIIPEMLGVGIFPPEFHKILTNLKEKVEWLENENQLTIARWLSVDTLYHANISEIVRPSVFALIDRSFFLQRMDSCFGVFRKYFIISNNEENLDTQILPWTTSRNPFGVKFEHNVGYLTEAGVLDYWEKNYQIFRFLQEVRLFHDKDIQLGNSEKNYTNYLQKAIINRKESNSAELVREGKPIGLVKIKMLFLLYAFCVGIAALCYIVEKYQFIKKFLLMILKIR
ncbi:hypothetical protein Fcan01_19151 [Folsomia candida]|uniref:Uncharacterized protein n=1 Tax=Folsomia candida TaxID=158441 RepID=A0A226DKJ7_FOLCA|nr:hypothetical protein Fcan01_19151 [Folsomia candida]